MVSHESCDMTIRRIQIVKQYTVRVTVVEGIIEPNHIVDFRILTISETMFCKYFCACSQMIRVIVE